MISQWYKFIQHFDRRWKHNDIRVSNNSCGAIWVWLVVKYPFQSTFNIIIVVFSLQSEKITVNSPRACFNFDLSNFVKDVISSTHRVSISRRQRQKPVGTVTAAACATRQSSEREFYWIIQKCADNLIQISSESDFSVADGRPLWKFIIISNQSKFHFLGWDSNLCDTRVPCAHHTDCSESSTDFRSLLNFTPSQPQSQKKTPSHIAPHRTILI